MKETLKRLVELLLRNRRLDSYLTNRYARAFGTIYPPGHYASPWPDLAAVKQHRATLFRRDVDLGPSIDLAVDRQKALVLALSAFYADFQWPSEKAAAHRYYLNNPSIGHGDAVILYAMLRHLAPRRVIEVGSGFTSALMLDTSDRFLNGRTAFTFIEPEPERLRSLLRAEDRDRYHVVDRPVQEIPIATFDVLEAGDILFIDSSHVSKIGSDVNYLLFEVLPALKPGVVVHFHDVYWPFEYPEEWIEEGRAWSEAYLLRAFLQYNDRFTVLLFNSYLGYACQELLQTTMPLVMTNPGGSLWLRKT